MKQYSPGIKTYRNDPCKHTTWDSDDLLLCEFIIHDLSRLLHGNDLYHDFWIVLFKRLMREFQSGYI